MFFRCFLFCRYTLFFFIVISSLSSNLVAKENADIVNQLISQARSQKLWLQRDWRALIHYSPNLIGSGFKSLVDDPEFFLAEQGQISPQLELEETIKYLFNTSVKEQSIACRFPARVAFLTKVLLIDGLNRTDSKCIKLNNWLKNLKADSLTIVFPVSVLNSPGSLFGHTFLRLDRNKEKKPDLLAWTINYAAKTEGEKGVSFAIKGLFGGYPGKFTLAPYYLRVKEYSDIESRDMWEYQLNFNQQEIQILLLHLWELLPSYSNYFFVDENCAYQLLALLQVVRPELKLTDQFYWDASPAATIRALVETPNLLKNINYRPSNRRIIAARASQLSPDDKTIARDLGEGELLLADRTLTTHKKQAEILELAYDYAAYLEAIDKKPLIDFGEKLQDKQALLYQLLSARNKLAMGSRQPKIKIPKYRPDQSHKGHRLGIRSAYEEPQYYFQIDYRWAYHDLYDPSNGFVKGAQLEFLKPAFRYYPEKNSLKLEAIDFVNIISSPVRDDFIRPLSWEVSVSIKRHRFDENYRPLMGDFNLGVGLSYELSKKTYATIIASTQILMADDFDQYIALSGGGKMRVISNITDDWQVGVSAQIMQFYQGISHTAYHFGGTQRLSIGRNNAIVVDISKVRELGDDYLKAQLSWQYYF